METYEDGIIALFTAEIALDSELKLFAGGQGYLVGDMAKSAKSLGIPMVVVSMLNHFGYYDQVKNGIGMEVKYVYRDYKNILEDTGLTFPINICPYPTWAKGLNWVHVWKIPEDRFGTVPIYLLDTDIPENDALARMNSWYLYGGISTCGYDQMNLDQRYIAQNLILGKCGVKALRRLAKNGQIKPVRKYHFNEAHCAFGALEVFSDHLKKVGNIQKALELTRREVVFTTHTPIKAGTPECDLEVVCKIAGINGDGRGLTRDLLKHLGGERFNMAAACIRLSGKWNAVSKRHLEVVREMWGWLGESAVEPISITNGVNQDWQWPEFRPETTTIEEHNAAKLKYKCLANERVAEEYEGRRIDDGIPWLDWSRRFAGYKRVQLLFDDLNWLSQQLKSKKFALVVAGKPHPDDHAQIEKWSNISGFSNDRENFPNLVILTNYDPALSKLLKGAADVWVNTPRASNESSGTSGMGAGLNEALNVSIPDGWMFEANPKNHFLFGSAYPMMNMGTQDTYDRDELKTAVGNALTMLSNQEEAHRMRLAAKKEIVEVFNSDRVMEEYRKYFYQ